MTKEDDILTDGRGVKLCRNCYDGNHYFKWGVTKDHNRKGQIVKFFHDAPKGCFSNCMQGACECPCVKLQLEKPNRVTPKQRKDFQKKLQQTLFTDNVSEPAK